MNVDLPLPKVKLAADLAVLHKPGAVRLDGYPHLVYAPIQHGAEIRLGHSGTRVSDLVLAFAVTPDPAAVAAQFREVTAEEVAEAVRYAVECGAAMAIAPEG